MDLFDLPRGIDVANFIGGMINNRAVGANLLFEAFHMVSAEVVLWRVLTEKCPFHVVD